MPPLIVVSHLQLRPALEAWHAGHRSVEVSLDLGLSTREMLLGEEGPVLPGGHTLPWDDVRSIVDDEQHCYLIEGAAPRRLSLYSHKTGRHLTLMPTETAPTLLVSGIAMHRIKGCDPHRDTLAKIRAVGIPTGHVLDTCTGLGYTAIAAARSAREVVTIELDPGVLDIARFNPWSQELFTNMRITRILDDCVTVIEAFEDESFSCVIHDPPAMRLSGELYSAQFYEQLWRVMRRGGRLYHYVGDPTSRSGKTVTRGVMGRLREAGFRRVRQRPDAFGVTAIR